MAARADDAGTAAERPFHSVSADELRRELGARDDGLTAEEAERRLATFGPNGLPAGTKRGPFRLFAAQFANPLSWLLLFAVGVSSLASEWTDAIVVLAILFFGAVLGFAQERRAESAVAALRAKIALRTDVLRAGVVTSVPTTMLVPGDVVLLAAGSLVPADGVVLAAKDFNVTEGALTGESMPVEKAPGTSPPAAPLRERKNAVYRGTSVQSGSARMLVVKTGARTEFGGIAERLAGRAPETDFDLGLRRFGHLLTRLMFVLVMFTTAANVLSHKPAVASLLFAISLAVGLAPEMLPAIVAINLARGASRLAQRGVIVRRPSTIENLGSMDVLCTDKTGTLTEGRVVVERAIAPSGAASERVLELAFQNASLQMGLKNALDAAIVERASADKLTCDVEKLDEVPYDFLRKRVTVVVAAEGGARLLMKGAVGRVMEVCTHERGDDGAVRPFTDDAKARRSELVDVLGAEGVRCLAVASKEVARRTSYDHGDEEALVFEGMLELRDRPKEGAAAAIADLDALGVAMKMISGDARAVAVHLAREVGMKDADRVLTGAELDSLTDEALFRAAETCGVFAEVDPRQKERIIRALRHAGHVVGYMGDGINDAPAIHAADVGISVDDATDVARDAADFVLLERDLRVLHDGIREGRVTFANTLKYLFTTESANFGNMISMALAAAFLPFLPLLAGQVLLNNFLSDLPATAIATDAVDEEQLTRPLRWDLGFIKRFMIVFGLVSSVFDLVTFGVLLYGLHASPAQFRTGWFVESLLTELAVALVVRTRRPFFRSRPSSWLLGLSTAVAVVAVTLPFTTPGRWLGLEPLPGGFLALLGGICLAYVACVEATKRVFFRRLAAA